MLEYELQTVPVGAMDMWRTTTTESAILTEAHRRRLREHRAVVEITGTLFPLGYTFNTDVYCRGCILWVIADEPIRNKPFVYSTLRDWARARRINMDDETSYDSNSWPKAIFASQITGPAQCSRCLCHFGQDPNEAGWCPECNTFPADCGHVRSSEQPKPEYRANCSNGDTYGRAEIETTDEGTTVTLHADDADLAAETGFASDFPHTETFTGEYAAHRFARDFADALITEAIAASGDGADLGAYTVQCLNGAYLTEGDS